MNTPPNLFNIFYDTDSYTNVNQLKRLTNFVYQTLLVCQNVTIFLILEDYDIKSFYDWLNNTNINTFYHKNKVLSNSVKCIPHSFLKKSKNVTKNVMNMFNLTNLLYIPNNTLLLYDFSKLIHLFPTSGITKINEMLFIPTINDIETLELLQNFYPFNTLHHEYTITDNTTICLSPLENHQLKPIFHIPEHLHVNFKYLGYKLNNITCFLTHIDLNSTNYTNGVLDLQELDIICPKNIINVCHTIITNTNTKIDTLEPQIKSKFYFIHDQIETETEQQYITEINQHLKNLKPTSNKPIKLLITPDICLFFCNQLLPKLDKRLKLIIYIYPLTFTPENTNFTFDILFKNMILNKTIEKIYSINPKTIHPKLKNLPLGIINTIQLGLENESFYNDKKYNLLENKSESESEIENKGLESENKSEIENKGEIESEIESEGDPVDYYFTLINCSNDNHRHLFWKALYLCSIPVVKSQDPQYIEYLKKLNVPFIEFNKSLIFNKILYRHVLRQFSYNIHSIPGLKISHYF